MRTKQLKDPAVEVVKNESAGNGATDEPKIPVEVKLEEVDLLKLQLLSEKQRRVQSDIARMETERGQIQADINQLVAGLNTKYGVDFNKYTILPDQGIAKLRE
jgi:hypothetical protein